MPDAARIHPLLSDPGGQFYWRHRLAGAIYGQVVANVSDRYLNDIFAPPSAWCKPSWPTSRLSAGTPSWKPQPVIALSDQGRAAGHLPAQRQQPRSIDRWRYCHADRQLSVLQRVPDTGYMLTLGPIDYLYFLREIQSFDYLLLGLAALFLGCRPFSGCAPVAAAHPSEMGGQAVGRRQSQCPRQAAG